ncbi:MAG: hypothetical protein P1U47_12260 [Zhongshania sp.]|uniref:hypothetical protein n=1 Tax=Zhongshania sp. TaxID=1971902 RepID=UPI002612D6C9|nr:hypothetical protein [Zhongshania sp.]MDF1693144.1 hypothetical protein [Zhongshania sp.]
MLSNRVGVKSIQVLALSLAAVFSLPLSVFADEPVQLIEEVTVVGAVRSSATIVVADIDVAGDESLQEMPVAYE